MADVQGLDAFRSAIAAVQQRLTAALPAVVAAAALPIHQEVDQRMPRRTGKTERALETIVSQDGKTATAVVQVRDSAVGEENEAAVFLEFGTSKMAAEPFFRPGCAAAVGKASEAAANKLAEVVGK